MRYFTWARALVAVTVVLWGGISARAQQWPTRPVHVVVAFAPGGAADLIARLVAKEYERAFGQPFIVDNRPGAGGLVGTEFVARSAPDGYTLIVTSNGQMSVAPAVRKAPYDPVTDFSYVALLGRTPYVLAVGASSPYQSLAEFVAAAKAKPGQFSFASAGPATLGHLTGELIKPTLGISMRHIAYRGSSQVQSDLLGGRLDAIVDGLTAHLALIEAGQIRPLAVTGQTRSTFIPNVPTFAELGFPGIDSSAFFVLAGPNGLPPAITERLNLTTAAALATPSLQDKLAPLAIVADGRTASQDIKPLVATDLARWKAVVTDNNLKFEN